MSIPDGCQRPISYLRVSVTDRCNLRCMYCMPPEGVPYRGHNEILRYEEIERVVRAAAGLGIHKVRITGGEPLVRAGIVDLVALLARIPGVDDLSMTTNGILLPRYADDLARAGLKRVNVSLDTLRPERYARITHRGQLSDALAGIESAERAGLQPVKINMVVLRGINDDEVVDMARMTLEHAWHVRFIELMPLNSNPQRFDASYMPNAEVRALIAAALGELHPEHPFEGGGPAAYYRLPGADDATASPGTVGFISPVSDHFCGQCNRLRLTADGRLRPCLLSDFEFDLRPLLRRGASMDELQDWLRKAILAKPAEHHLAEHVLPNGRVMSEIGG